jgi:phospholipase C
MVALLCACVPSSWQVYHNVGSDSVGYYMYNDEKPDGSTSSYRGHTKGVSAFDANGGFFLDHSVPRFPPKAEDAYEFPANEATYDSMHCRHAARAESPSWLLYKLLPVEYK